MTANEIWPSWDIWSSYAWHQTAISANCEGTSCEIKDLNWGSKELWNISADS